MWPVVCERCGEPYAAGRLGRCPRCSGILRPEYPPEAIGSLARVESGAGIGRYRATLPTSVEIPSLGEGGTPLLPSRRIGPALGLTDLWWKHEGRNPSGAFKDRGAALIAALAIEAGSRGILTASSGNAAAALATYTAACGLPCLILLEPGNPLAKLRQALACGASCVFVEDLFGHGPAAVGELLRSLSQSSGYYLAFIWAPVNPYALEAMKTISYEIAAQLEQAPDVLVCPVGGGDLLTAQWRGYQELLQAGRIDHVPRMVAVQSAQAAPLLAAFQSGSTRVEPIAHPHSLASGINVPFSGEHALDAVRQSGGTVVAMPDDDILAAQRRLAVEEGVWVEPASAATLAAVPQLLRSGALQPSETIVCLLSGAGFKDPHLGEAETAAAAARTAVPFDIGAILAALHLA